MTTCQHCGGHHIGQNKCPFLGACAVCGDMTVMGCSDCGIAAGGTKTTHVCKKAECRRAHEASQHPVHQ
jgi:hypothetical protein